jgi:dCMP deaminase
MNPGNDRPDLHLYFMRMARLVATRSTCLRRAVGCVLVDGRGHVLSTGYNGVAAGERHCNDVQPIGVDFQDYGNGVSIPKSTKPSYPFACLGAQAPSGMNLQGCRAVHAEQNALLQCRDPYNIWSIYVTTAPCDSCLKLFLNTSARELIVGEWYARPDGTSNREHVTEMWHRTGLSWSRGGDDSPVERGLIYEGRS